MKLKDYSGISLFLCISALLLIGCNRNSRIEASDVSISPDKVHSTILLFDEVDNQNFNSVGSLYKMNLGDNRDSISKVADNVISDSFYFINDSEEIIYRDASEALYLYTTDDDALLISDNVMSYSIDYISQDIIIYEDENFNFYVYSNEINDRLSTDIIALDVLDNEVYYIDQNHNFISYNFKNRQERRIKDDVHGFDLLNGEGDFVYWGSSDGIYYQDKMDNNSNTFRLSSNSAIDGNVLKSGNYLFFTSYDNNYNKKYEIKEISSNNNSFSWEKDNIFKASVRNNSVYYLSDDNTLYQASIEEDSTVRIASDILYFDLLNEGVIMLSSENKLYKWTEEEPLEVVGNDVSYYDFNSEGDVAYINNDFDLYKNNTRVTSDTEYYSYYHGNLVYEQDNNLYHINQNNVKEELMTSVDEFSKIYYQNEIVFEKLMSLSDITGIYEFIEFGESIFVEIKPNGDFVNLLTEETLELNVSHAMPDYLVVETIYGESIEFFYENNKLFLQSGYDYAEMIPTNMNNFQEYIETQHVDYMFQYGSQLLESFKSELDYSIFYGMFNYVSGFLASDSSAYNEIRNYINLLYEEGIAQDLIYFEITDYNLVSNNVITITTREEYELYEWFTYTGSSIETFELMYTIEEVNGEFRISSIVPISQL